MINRFTSKARQHNQATQKLSVKGKKCYKKKFVARYSLNKIKAVPKPDPEVASRAALRKARRVCVKVGTNVVVNEDGRASLTRLGAMVDQLAELINKEGVEVILVSSGAVGMGKRLLRKQHKFASLDDVQLNMGEADKKKIQDSACASAGQLKMMGLYDDLFSQCDVVPSQVLVTQADFIDENRLSNLKYSVERLLSLGIMPIINENDTAPSNEGYQAFTDNDSLAALCARAFGAEVLLLLTDVDGVYDRPPSEPGARLLSMYHPDLTHVAIGTKSSQGRGGMASKIAAAQSAVVAGTDCRACVIAPGSDLEIIRSVLGNNYKNKSRGTLFCTPGSELEKLAINEYESEIGGKAVSEEAHAKATLAHTEARKLLSLPYSVRQNILNSIADALIERKNEIFEANRRDLDAAVRDGVEEVLFKRLKLTEEKLSTLAAGLRHLADIPDPLGVIKSKLEVSENLELSLITVPIGVLLVIFESRPDSMPQISALALASGNGLLLKGGKEASESNTTIHRVIGDAIEKGSGGKISRDIIALVTSRGQIAEMLKLEDVIDLVIPRGSNDLVSYIKSNTKIPVLGHADGVCHVYVDESADYESAIKVVLDAKTDYPTACNAMETLLLHEGTIDNGVAAEVLMALRAAGVKCLGGPNAMKAGLSDTPALELKYEYGNLTCMVEVVSNMEEAIDWIHTYGSGHTEAIVCNNPEIGEEFLKRVDSSCVFLNASTRFADGFRFGLGAEVGISTTRIHARGPVGVEGLLTTKWQLRATADSHAVSEFSGKNPKKVYTHRPLLN